MTHSQEVRNTEVSSSSLSANDACIEENHLRSSKLELDPEIVENNTNSIENFSGNIVITPTGVNKTSSTDDITTCTTSGDTLTPMESSSTLKRPREEALVSEKLKFLEPAAKSQNVEGKGIKDEVDNESSFIRDTDDNIVFKKVETNEDGVEINNRTESNSTDILSTTDTSKSTTASASPLNQHQNSRDENVPSGNLNGRQTTISSRQLFDELVQLATSSGNNGNVTLMNTQQFASVDNGVIQQSLQNFGLLMGNGYCNTLGGTGTPIKSQSPVSNNQVGTSQANAEIHSNSSPTSPMNNSNNPLISQIMSNPLFHSQTLTNQSSQNLNRMVSAAFGVGSHPFNWTATNNPTNPNFCSAIPASSTQPNVANIAALIAAANSQMHNQNSPFAVPFPTPVNRTIGATNANHILMSMQSNTPSDGSTYDSTHASTNTNANACEAGTSSPSLTQNDSLLRMANSFGPSSAGNGISPYWHANSNLLAAASSMINSNDLSSAMAVFNNNSLNLQHFLQLATPLVPHNTAISEDGNSLRSSQDTLSNAYAQQNCLSLLASIQQNMDFSNLSTSNSAALAALTNVTSGAQLISGSHTPESEKKPLVKSSSSGNSGGRSTSGSSSRSLSSSSSVTAAAAALDHLDVDWDSVGLREAELAAMEICKTASSLFETTDGTTPVPSSPAAVGEAVLTAAQLTISARAMLKFVKSLTPTQLGINWHACTQRFCVTYTTRDEQNPRSWTLGAYSNGKLHYKYFGPRSWTVMGLKEALRKAFKARTSLLLGQGIIEEPEDTGLSKEELTYHARQLLQQLRDSLGVKKGNVHKGLYISWHPKTRRFVVALKSCESGKTIYKYFSPKERSIKGIKTALLDAHQMVVAACQ